MISIKGFKPLYDIDTRYSKHIQYLRIVLTTQKYQSSSTDDVQSQKVHGEIDPSKLIEEAAKSVKFSDDN